MELNYSAESAVKPNNENGSRPLLEAIDLTKRYEDGVLALDHISFSVYPGQIYTMLGANGAGKTTAINLFLNFIDPTEGEARIDGIPSPSAAKLQTKFIGKSLLKKQTFTR